MHVTNGYINFCKDPKCAYVKRRKAVQQHHVNCLINTWVSVD